MHNELEGELEEAKAVLAGMKASETEHDIFAEAYGKAGGSFNRGWDADFGSTTLSELEDWVAKLERGEDPR